MRDTGGVAFLLLLNRETKRIAFRIASTKEITNAMRTQYVAKFCEADTVCVNKAQDCFKVARSTLSLTSRVYSSGFNKVPGIQKATTTKSNPVHIVASADNRTNRLTFGNMVSPLFSES